MLFLVYKLGSVWMGKREGNHPLLNFAVVVEANSPQEVADKLGVDYNPQRESLFFPDSLFQGSEDLTPGWVFRRGNFVLRAANPVEFRRDGGVILKIQQINKI